MRKDGGSAGDQMRSKLAIAIFLLAAVSAGFGSTTSGLPFIHDDYGKGLAEAKQRKLPIFVECWAPW